MKMTIITVHVIFGRFLQNASYNTKFIRQYLCPGLSDFSSVSLIELHVRLQAESAFLSSCSQVFAFFLFCLNTLIL